MREETREKLISLLINIWCLSWFGSGWVFILPHLRDEQYMNLAALNGCKGTLWKVEA